jgi:hypothetical protein
VLLPHLQVLSLEGLEVLPHLQALVFLEMGLGEFRARVLEEWGLLAWGLLAFVEPEFLEAQGQVVGEREPPAIRNRGFAE